VTEMYWAMRKITARPAIVDGRFSEIWHCKFKDFGLA
jgi:hypothetical protein